MKDLLIFTCNYKEPTIDLRLLRRSCELYDIELATYGDDVDWPGHKRGKIIDAAAFLSTRPEPFAMFVDGRDTIVLDRAERILDTYQKIGSEIVIAAEKTCWPNAELWTHYPYPRPPFQTSPWRYINSGGWIGERGALMNALYTAADYDGELWNEDDQMCWTDWFLRAGGRNHCVIDAGCQIFQCIGGTAGHEIGPTGENLITHTQPKVLHFNGRAPNIGLWYRNLTGDLGWRGE